MHGKVRVMGIVISISPMIAHLGPFALRWYSLLLSVAIVASESEYVGRVR